MTDEQDEEFRAKLSQCAARAIHECVTEHSRVVVCTLGGPGGIVDARAAVLVLVGRDTVAEVVDLLDSTRRREDLGTRPVR